MKEDSSYQEFISQLKEQIRTAQYKALKAVNQEYIQLCWDVGATIVHKQEELGWGKSVVNQVAEDLQTEFPGLKGFSASNLWRMRNFYLTYYEDQKLAPMVREIGWVHNVVIMEKCKTRWDVVLGGGGNRKSSIQRGWGNSQ